MKRKEIVITNYEEWMNSQAVQMFSDFYGTPAAEVMAVQKRFFEHPFQKDRVIRIAALKGEQVVGFVSFAYWPYTKNGTTYKSYQVGNAMIHPQYRGNGIFPMLLKYVDDHCKQLGVDFLFAFPHLSASYPSFMRSGYVNAFDMVWGVRIINPFAFLKNPESILKKFSTSPAIMYEGDSINFRLNRTQNFNDWFFGSRSINNYAYYNFAKGSTAITFYLKAHKRGRWLNELIIGDIRAKNADNEDFKKAFNSFFSIVLKSLAISIVSIAYNSCLPDQKTAIITRKFRKIKPIIHFVYRNYLEQVNLSNPTEWELYRADLDTW